MKNCSRLLVLLLASALLLSGLIGCGTTSVESSTSTEVSSVTSAETAPTEMAPAQANTQSEDAVSTAESVIAEDVIGTIGEKFDYPLPLYEETASLSIWYPQRNDGVTLPTHEDPLCRFWPRLEENLNVDIAWVEPSSMVASEQYNLMIASENLTDIIFEGLIRVQSGTPYVGGYDKAISDDVYLELTDLIPELAPNYWYYINNLEGGAVYAYTDEGRIAYFQTINSEKPLTSNGPVVNSDYIAETGLDIPDTIDGWLEVFAAMQSNGVEIPCASTCSGDLFDSMFINAIGGDITSEFVLDNQSGSLVYGPATDETREYLELFIACNQAGYVDPDFVSLPAFNMEQADLKGGVCATGNAMAAQIIEYEDLFGTDVTPVPIVRGEGLEAGQTNMGDMDSDFWNSGNAVFAISAQSECVESAIRLLDWFYSDDGFVICNYGWVEGELYNLVDGEYVVTDFYAQRDPENETIPERSLYSVDGDFGLKNPNIEIKSKQAALDVAMTWETDADWAGYRYYTLPTAVALTSSEAAEAASLFSDIDTHVGTQLLKWMVGEEELNDDTWNAYLSTLDEMSLSTCQTVYQAAYERYLEKLS